MSLEQRRLLIDSRQSWDAYVDALKREASYAGSVSWQTRPNGDYLVKIFDADTKVRKMKGLGRRSEATERIYREFTTGKVEAKSRLESISAKMQQQARFNRAADLSRVPITVAKILRRLHREGMLGRNVSVVGTNAIYAYEAAAGVFISLDLLATTDLDIRLDARRKLKLSVSGTRPESFLKLLASVDRSFESVAESGYRAANKDGFFVDLVKAEARPPWRLELDKIGTDDDLVASPMPNMKWLENAPSFESIAIDEDGMPVPFVCPDPRAFALYKFWMATKDPTRDPVKRPRDIAQANTIAHLVVEYLPALQFDSEHLKMFPSIITSTFDAEVTLKFDS